MDKDIEIKNYIGFKRKQLNKQKMYILSSLYYLFIHFFACICLTKRQIRIYMQID